MAHEGISLRFDGEEHRIDFADLTGRGIVVYGQQEVVKDLIAARLDDGGDVSSSSVSGVRIARRRRPTPRRSPTTATTGGGHELRCDVDRRLPTGSTASAARCVPHTAHDRAGLPVRLARGSSRRPRPPQDELVYAHHERRLRPLLDAQPRGHPALPAGPERHRCRRLVGRPDLGRAARAAGHRDQRGPAVREGLVTGMRSFVTEPDAARGSCSWPGTPRTSSRPPGRRA
jgi:p-hydroxybenzoate 3-monooxygenase